MPTGLKITVVFNFIAVAILCSVASMAEPAKITPNNEPQTAILNSAAAANVRNENQLDVIVIENGIPSDINREINQNVEKNRDATPAPWSIRADGSVQWLDVQ